MASPTVSIVIPTYNRASYIERAVQSALAQTYRDIEIIVCDNASQDNTAEIVARLQQAETGVPIRYLRHPENMGPVKNWFSGIHAASGDYIKILFSDDLLYPTCVEDLLNVLHGTRFAYSYGMVDNLWEGSRVTSYARLRPGCRVSAAEYVGVFFSSYLGLEDYPISPGAALFRTEVLREIPLKNFEDSFGFDVVASGIGPDMLMFMYSYLRHEGQDAVFVKRKVGAFEGHKQSITIMSGIDKLDDNNFSAVLKFFSLLPEDSSMRRLLESNFDQLAMRPRYFKRCDARLRLLEQSEIYQPVPRPRAFPFLGLVAAAYRRVQRSVEFRAIRLGKRMGVAL